ncbi:hypothetical protein GQ457_16G015750 [Hibiscus cannabinus]
MQRVYYPTQMRIELHGWLGLAQILTKYSIQGKSIKILSNYIHQKSGGFGKPDPSNGTPWSGTCAIVSGLAPRPMTFSLTELGNALVAAHEQS